MSTSAERGEALFHALEGVEATIRMPVNDWGLLIAATVAVQSGGEVDMKDESLARLSVVSVALQDAILPIVNAVGEAL